MKKIKYSLTMLVLLMSIVCFSCQQENVAPDGVQTTDTMEVDPDDDDDDD
ncbi:MAG: hypothetical protein Roseis2KO_30350 [Roseivirga sp.]